MADTKVTALAENTTVASTDMLYLVDDPGGTPASQKATAANVCLGGMVNIGASVHNNSVDHTIATATWTDLTFSHEDYDTDTVHSTVANTERLTATTAGVYIITGTVVFDANNTGNRGLGVYYNNTTFLVQQTVTANTTSNSRLCVTALYDLTATDYVTLRVYQNSGGNLNTNGAACFFGMQRIA